MKKIINNIDSYIEYFKENIIEINKIIYRQYGLYPNKLVLLKTNEREMLQLPMTKSIILSSLLEDLTKGEEMDFEVEDLENSFLVNTKSKFLEVISYEEQVNKIIVSELDTQMIFSLSVGEDLEISKGDIIFSFTYEVDGEPHLYENFVILDDEESQKILDVFSEYYVEDELDVYFDNVIVHRIMSIYLDNIDTILNKYNSELSSKYNSEALFNFFKHIGNVAKFNFKSNENIDLFEVDYFEFLMNEAKEGNFVMEGELENFIEILEFIVNKESKSQDEKLEAFKSIKYCLDNIFVIKKNILNNHPLTPVDLVYDIDEIMVEAPQEVTNLTTMGFFIETISDMPDVKITKKTKRLSTKTIREYCETYFTNVIDENNNIDPKIKSILELALSIILGNKLGGVDSEDNLYLKSRYNFFTSNNLAEYMANILQGVFRVETIEHYIGKKSLDYEKLLEKLKDSIRKESFYNLENTSEGKKLLEILSNLGIISTSYLNDYKHYKLEELGQVLKERFEKKTEKAKVLKLKK